MATNKNVRASVANVTTPGLAQRLQPTELKPNSSQADINRRKVADTVNEAVAVSEAKGMIDGVTAELKVSDKAAANGRGMLAVTFLLLANTFKQIAPTKRNLTGDNGKDFASYLVRIFKAADVNYDEAKNGAHSFDTAARDALAAAAWLYSVQAIVPLADSEENGPFAHLGLLTSKDGSKNMLNIKAQFAEDARSTDTGNRAISITYAIKQGVELLTEWFPRETADTDLDVIAEFTNYCKGLQFADMAERNRLTRAANAAVEAIKRTKTNADAAAKAMKDAKKSGEDKVVHLKPTNKVLKTAAKRKTAKKAA